MSKLATSAFLGSVAVSVLLMLAVPLHAKYMRSLRARDTAAIREIAPRLPSGDLSLSGGARWLRFPSLEEPNAAFADGPAVPDPDPAGGSMAPPFELYRRPR
jgi:hypothetical protein